jgi:molecular chaperone HscB
VKLADDDFTLLGLAPQQQQDLALLDQRWRELQAATHPDRFAAEGAAAQRVAMQWATRLNQARQRLRDPLSRAAYLCELQGVAIDAERNTAMPAEFLMQQMHWREALDDATGLPAVEALASEVATAERTAIAALHTLIDERRDFTAAAAQVRALMFVRRFAEDLARRLEALDA